MSFASLWFLGRYLRPNVNRKRMLLTVKKADVPPQGALVFRESRVAILREEEKLFALDLTCTHLGCTVAVHPTELVCPCHGSAFDRSGKVTRGPANRPLARYTVRERGDSYEVLA